jgi:hypothetical protein
MATISNRIRSIFLNQEKYITEDNDIDLHKIASVSSKVILAIDGIGKVFLNEIADTLEAERIIKKKDWLAGKVVAESKPQKIEELDRNNLLIMQSYFYTFIGANSLSLDVMQWLLDAIGVDNIRKNINEIIYAYGLTERYKLHLELSEKLKLEDDIKRTAILKELIAYNKHAAAKESGILFYQGHWDASIAQWIYISHTGEAIDQSAIELLPIKINKCIQNLIRMNYSFDFGKEIIPVELETTDV